MREFTRRDAKVGSWETYIARPSMVLPNPPGVFNSWAGWALGAVRVDQLAATMVDIVQKGNENEIFENADLVQYAERMGFSELRT